MDALRAKGDLPDRRFVMRYLKVQDGCDPQSKDGKNRDERGIGGGAAVGRL